MRAHLSTDSNDPAHTTEPAGTNGAANAASPANSSPANAASPAAGAGVAPVDEAGIARLFEMTSDLLAAISLDGRFTLLNPAWEHVLGWSIEELTEQPMHERVHPDDIEQTLALTQAGRNRSAQLVNFTNRYRHRTARGGGCCGARGATARCGTRQPRT